MYQRAHVTGHSETFNTQNTQSQVVISDKSEIRIIRCSGPVPYVAISAVNVVGHRGELKVDDLGSGHIAYEYVCFDLIGTSSLACGCQLSW